MITSRLADRLQATSRRAPVSRLALVALLVTAPLLAADETSSPRTLTLLGVDAGAPQQLAASLVLVFASRDDSFELAPHNLSGSGIALRVEPGITGGELGFGLLSMRGALGYSLEAVGLRTWGDDPWMAETGTTYIGASASLYGWGLHVRLGPLYGVGGDDRGGWAAVASIGLGF